MKNYKLRRQRAAAVLGSCLGLVLGMVAEVSGQTEPKVDVLQIGTETYRNVTVMNKTRTHVAIVHSGGMATLKLADLPGEALVQLGYPDPNAPKVSTNAATAWAKHAMARVEVPEFKKVEQELVQGWSGQIAGQNVSLPPITRQIVYILLGGLLAAYLFHCFCCMLICKKAGKEPGIWVWLPIIQVFPLLAAARMSAWWFLALCVPVLDLIAGVAWCVNIAKARQKSLWTAIFLILPVTSFFAFLYLAFSKGGRRNREDRRIQIMTLETA